MIMDLSREQLASFVPSGDQATCFTSDSWPDSQVTKLYYVGSSLEAFHTVEV